jgi:hypothetical protein
MLNWKCNFLILSHLEVVMDKETGAVIKIQPLLPGALSDLLPGYFDEVYVASVITEQNTPHYKIQTATRGHYKARSRASGKEGRLPMYLDHTNVNGYEMLMKALKDGKLKKPGVK